MGVVSIYIVDTLMDEFIIRERLDIRGTPVLFLT